MSNFYPDELIEEIRLNNDIYEVVGEYVRLDRKGKHFFGLCPFHNEKTPSFSVTPEKQMFYCYGCGQGGNVVHFVMKIENLDFVEAIKHLAERARIALPEGDASDKEFERIKLKENLIKLNTEAARHFHMNLRSHKGASTLKYIIDRGINEKIVKSFGIGCSLEEWDDLYKYLMNRGFSDELIKTSGLVILNKNNKFSDRFRNRLMFPIFDIRGNVIGFGGRIINKGNDKADEKSAPKYMNSPETPVYNKSRSLYALNFAKNSPNRQKMIIVEGYMDAVSLHQHGITNVVASLGTALTESQGRLLRKYSEELIIAYDADAAGQAATLRGLDVLNKIGCTVRVLSIPEGKDPDDFIKLKGRNEFEKLIESSVSLVEYKVRMLKSQIDTSSVQGKISFLNKTADILSKVNNDVERDVYIKKISHDMDISAESIYSEIMKKTRPKTDLKERLIIGSRQEARKTEPDEVRDEPLILAEQMLLSLVCSDNRIYRMIRNEFSERDFTGRVNGLLAEKIFRRIEEGKDPVPAEMVNTLTAEEEIKAFSQITNTQYNFDDNFKAALDIIRKINISKIEKRRKEILNIIKSKADSEKGDVEKLKQELSMLMIEKKKISG